MAGLVVGRSGGGHRDGAADRLGRSRSTPGADLLRGLSRAARVGRLLLVLTTLTLALVGCQAARARPAATSPPSSEGARYAEAHRRSIELRTGLAGWAAGLAHGAGAGDLAPDAAERLRVLKREYFALRETLFELALLHAAAVVEEPGRRDPRALLVEISLSLMAGTDLVGNFHAVAAPLAERPALREVWNEADPALGIPAGGWEAALLSYRSAQYHDLFKRAIERVTAGRRPLERWRAAGDGDVLALYGDGVEAGLDAAGRAFKLLRAGLAEEDLARDTTELRTLVDRSRAARAAWTGAAQSIRGAIGRDGGLIRGAVHVRLQAIKREYLELREGLYGLAFKHLPKLTREDIPYPYGFRLRAVGISVLAAATLYENAHAIETEILGIPRVKPLLNQGDPALGIRPGFWDHVEAEFVRAEYRLLLEGGIRALDQSRSLAPDSMADEDPFLAYVSRELLATGAVEEARRDRAEVTLGWWLRRQVARVGLIEAGMSGSQVQASKTFGNFMGVFEFRKGKLFDQPDWVRFVSERLEPGDLLLEKTPFRLTDKFIPGHFGHVALYVGTRAQLTALGLADHPWVRPHWAALGDGRVIVEALREGTQINSVERFLNIDDLAILRPKPGLVPRADVLQAITLAFTHVGKKYDFAFDTNTWDTIVCSELAFQAYVNVRWPFARVLASYTISPDDVAVMAGADPARPFELVTFIHDGQLVHDRASGRQGEPKYIELLGRRYETALR